MFGPLGPHVVDPLLQYHRTYGGLSRYVKFQWLYDNILKQPLPEEEKLALGARFSELVEEQVVLAPYIDGALESIHALHAAGIPSYVVSGTPQDELRRITARRGLDPFFKGVYGSPKLKPEIVEEVLAEHGFSRKRCLFIGTFIFARSQPSFTFTMNCAWVDCR